MELQTLSAVVLCSEVESGTMRTGWNRSSLQLET